MGKARQPGTEFSYGGFQIMLVQVKQVVLDKMMAMCVDTRNQQYKVPLAVLPNAYRMPEPGEWWYVEKMLGQWVFKAISAQNAHQIYRYHEVLVESIEEEYVLVRSTTDTSKTFRINPSIKRYKSYETPEIGETWIIDNALGIYTFAAFVGTSDAPVPPPAPPMAIIQDWTTLSLNTGYTHNGNSGGTVMYKIYSMLGDRYAIWRGAVARATDPAPGNTVAVLPEIARPDDSVLVTVATARSAQAASTTPAVRLDFQPIGGNINMIGGTVGSSPAPTWVGFHGINYLIGSDS